VSILPQLAANREIRRIGSPTSRDGRPAELAAFGRHRFFTQASSERRFGSVLLPVARLPSARKPEGAFSGGSDAPNASRIAACGLALAVANAPAIAAAASDCPNVWHGAVVPLADAAELLDRQGRVHARVSVDFAKEFGCYLSLPLRRP
jgi:hypothetical protein